MALIDNTERNLVLPSTAVVREGNGDYVFLKTGPNTFLLRPVKLAEESGDDRVLLDGLKDGDQIVLDGAFHLNNERKWQSIDSGEGAS